VRAAIATGTYLVSVRYLTIRPVVRRSDSGCANWIRDSLSGVPRHEAVQLLRGARSWILQTGGLLHPSRILLVQIVPRRSGILAIDRGDSLPSQLVAMHPTVEKLTPICWRTFSHSHATLFESAMVTRPLRDCKKASTSGSCSAKMGASCVRYMYVEP
jgi:hypothetical protein